MKGGVRSIGAAIAGATAVGMTILLVPTLLVAISSFTRAEIVGFPPDGFTFHWYIALGESRGIVHALGNSLLLAFVATGVGLAAGVPAALGLYRYRVKFAVLLDTALAFGFAAPVVVSGLGFFILFTELGILNHVPVIAVAVAIANLPFMVWAVAAAISGINPELEEAASTLGAEEVQRFLFVILPSIAPGVLTGAVLMFIMSFTDFLLSLLLVNSETATLPVFLFGGIRGGAPPPTLAAVSVLYVVVAALSCAVAMKRGRLGEFIERRQI
jgi:putative spermidine/putrescine transport system permease protein